MKCCTVSGVCHCVTAKSSELCVGLEPHGCLVLGSVSAEGASGVCVCASLALSLSDMHSWFCFAPHHFSISHCFTSKSQIERQSGGIQQPHESGRAVASPYSPRDGSSKAQITRPIWSHSAEQDTQQWLDLFHHSFVNSFLPVFNFDVSYSSTVSVTGPPAGIPNLLSCIALPQRNRRVLFA